MSRWEVEDLSVWIGSILRVSPGSTPPMGGSHYDAAQMLILVLFSFLVFSCPFFLSGMLIHVFLLGSHDGGCQVAAFILPPLFAGPSLLFFFWRCFPRSLPLSVHFACGSSLVAFRLLTVRRCSFLFVLILYASCCIAHFAAASGICCV